MKIVRPVFSSFLLLFVFFAGSAFACSEVYIGGDQNVSARNFDFMVGDGIAVLAPRGQAHESGYASKGEDKLSWVSRYGSLSFRVKLPGCKENAQGGYVLAGVDGINEKGFKIGTYFLETSEFAEGGKGKTLAITSLMQYLLDNFETVDSALTDLQHSDYRVVPVPTGAVPVKLHLYLHDCKGKSAIVEFMDGTVVLHRHPDVPVLTNTAYKEALSALKGYVDFGGEKYIPGGNESMDRFIRGAFYRKHLPEPRSAEEAVASGLAIVQILSVSPKFDHGCTQWTIVSDVDNKTVFFRTLGNPTVSYLDLDLVDFSKGQPVKTLDFTRKDLSGNIKEAFAAQ